MKHFRRIEMAYLKCTGRTSGVLKCLFEVHRETLRVIPKMVVPAFAGSREFGQTASKLWADHHLPSIYQVTPSHIRALPPEKKKNHRPNLGNAYKM